MNNQRESILNFNGGGGGGVNHRYKKSNFLLPSHLSAYITQIW
ncbi:MAG: hypothetical protein V5A68_02940 [Candidatus Thermoplasmatota archaeon]